jgi:PTH1 family peptidyl-tRNA hydrolase
MAYEGIIVGLGNPGARYEATRHNFGFRVVDALVVHWLRNKEFVCRGRDGQVAQAWEVAEVCGGRTWLVLKPQTYMNLSGQALARPVRTSGMPAQRVLVLHDELDLPLGVVRFKVGGGLAGHNGLKSIAQTLGSHDFVRLRLGIGRPPAGVKGADYVLQEFSPQERAIVEESILVARDAVLQYCAQGVAAATQWLHGRP